MRIPGFMFVSVFTVMLVVAGAAQAAPQMLAVVATAEPMPMDCKDGTCTASLSSICLQEERPSPKNGTAYTPVDMDAFEVVLTDRRGEQHAISAADAGLNIENSRSYFAVRAQLSPDLLKTYGAIGATINVRADATLVPEPLPGDSSPITAHEIAHIAKGLRPLAERWIGNEQAKTAAAQTLNRWINEIATATSANDVIGELKQSAKRGGTGVFTGDVERFVSEVVGFCEDDLKRDRTASMDRCLEHWHDHLMYDLNTDYWDGIKPGS